MKKILKLGLCMCAMLISVYLIYNYYKDRGTYMGDDYISTHDDDFEMINSLKKKYNNNEIMMYFELPGVFYVPVVQTENNTYYLNHNIYKKELNGGTPFLDYRNKSLHDRKLIIYGHSTMNKTLPFSNFVNYGDKAFFDNHPSITIGTDNGKKTYDIFSVFNDNGEDESYIELNGFPGLEYYEHLLSLKNRSIYDTNVSIDENSKIIVIRTCAIESGCMNNPQYQIVVARENKAKLNNE